MSRCVLAGRVSALLAPAVAAVAIVGATLSAPEFSWAGDALSDLGAPGAPTAWLFNGGLIVAGVLGLPFAAVLVASARHRLDWLVAAVLALTLGTLAGVGLFPSGHPYHLPVAAGFYLGATLTLWIDGTTGVLTDEPRFGLAAIWLANLHVLQWLAWAAGLRVGPGLAIPETIGAALFAVWVLGRVD
ncbi:DUF998 domain-containing protein [Halalkalicoccus subterraneus]|uniref:DUF998 domain-containing protein n=1 Tax=Halalkalicoccus subterraneus TaxID=2675002 RepID=UPI000EFC9EFF|nr:DUF998 domain-containing protein [Halalkalicoccus subterraneus]